MHQGRVPPDEVHPYRVGGPVQCLGEVDGGGGGAGPGHHANGGDGNALVDDGDAILLGDVLPGLYQMLRVPADLIVDFPGGLFHVRVDAVQEGDAHGDGPDIQILVVDHVDGL